MNKKILNHLKCVLFLLALPLAFCAVGCEQKDVPTQEVSSDAQANARIAQAFQNGESDFVVETSGIVEKILPDDRDGSPHQRFIIRLSNGHTLLVAHNISLAPRVPGLKPGDEIRFRGEYEWNNKGGVVHWTHHDPKNFHQGGWIQFQGQMYN